MRIRVSGAHNTESSRTRMSGLIVDDVLALDAGALTSSLSFRNQLKIKAVLLTHGHYDHIRDIPAFAMNLFLRKRSADIYTHQAAADNLLRYFLDGGIYPEFHERPAGSPTIKLHIIKEFEEVKILDYSVIPVPVAHALPGMGYQITCSGKSIFYTGDTGPGLSQTWEYISPVVLFIELTASNRWTDAMKKNGHMTPASLQQELINFRQMKGYLPRIVCVHINPANEIEIRSEISCVSYALSAHIELAHEGMLITV